MKYGTEDLRAPVKITCDRLASRLLHDAGKTCARLEDRNDPEALHDFRVSIRRLVTSLRAYRTFLEKRGAKKLRSQLVGLIATTNTRRDQEVHLEWVRQQLETPGVAELQREGLRLLLQYLENEESHLVEGPAHRAAQEFAKIRVRLTHHLALRGAAPPRHPTAEPPTFALATGDIVRSVAGRLRQTLARIESIGDSKPAHRARLTAKRLRYVLEPLNHVMDGASASIRRLKTLQDVLGGLRDLQTLEVRATAYLEEAVCRWSQYLVSTARHETDVAPLTRKTPEERVCQALAAALQRVRTDERRLFDSLAGQWLGESATPFFAEIDRITRDLESMQHEPISIPPAPTPPPNPPSTSPEHAAAPEASTQETPLPPAEPPMAPAPPVPGQTTRHRDDGTGRDGGGPGHRAGERIGEATVRDHQGS